MINCRLCASLDSSTLYDGQIRSGGIGSEFISGFKIYKCLCCGFIYLDPIPDNLDAFYESPEYRSKFDYLFDPDSIHKKYDHEQNARIARIGLQNMRGKTVVDLGSSAGVFLDAVVGVAARTVAVEPGKMYQDYLVSKGHAWYPYPEDAIQSGERADIVVSFDVVEHLADPLKFIEQAFELLTPGGRLVLSMPNADDLILKAQKDAYAPFMFQVAHLNYFNYSSASYLFAKTDFEQVQIEYLHKYGIENLVQWSKHGEPGSSKELDGFFDFHFDVLYKSEIERLGLASHLFITAQKPTEKN